MILGRIEKRLLLHSVHMLRHLASRKTKPPRRDLLWTDDAKVKLAWIQPGRFEPERRKLIHRISGGKPLQGGLKVNSLAYLSAHTPEWVSQLMMDDNLADVDFELLERKGVNFVAISSMTQFAPRAYQIAEECRKRGMTTIIGGPHATLCPDEAQKHCDAVFVGEAEVLWTKVLEDFRDGKLRSLYRAGEYVDAKRFRPPNYNILPHAPFGVDSVQAGRGCPFNCKFCCVTTLYGRRLRMRPLAEVLDQVKGVHERGLNVFFTDDNIIGNRRYARDLFTALIEFQKNTDRPLLWGAQSTVNLAFDEELLALAAKAGCQSLYIGFESLSPEALEQAEKTHNSPERYKEALDRFRQRSIKVVASVMLGLPGERRETADAMFRLLLENDVRLIYYYILAPLPGTDLRKEFEDKGKLRVVDQWEKYDMLHVTFDPDLKSNGGWTASEVEETIWRYYLTFYRWRFIARRLYRNLRSDMRAQTGRKVTLPMILRSTVGDLYFSMVSRLLVRNRLHPFETP